MHIKLLSLGLVGILAVFSAYAAENDTGHDHSGKSNGHAHDAKATHGGVVVVVKDINYELVVKPDTVSLYLSDHGKPVNLADATAKLTLLPVSGERLDLVLAPAGDRLEVKGRFRVGPGAKAVVQIAMAGRAATGVRFNLK